MKPIDYPQTDTPASLNSATPASQRLKLCYVLIYHQGHNEDDFIKAISNIGKLVENTTHSFKTMILTNRLNVTSTKYEVIYINADRTGALLNKAISRAIRDSYDVLLKQDADDIAQYDRIQLQSEFIKANPGYIFYSGTIAITCPNQPNRKTRTYPTKPSLIHYLINKSLAHCAVAINLHEIGSLRYPLNTRLEDKIILSNPDVLGKVINQPECLLTYKETDGARSEPLIAYTALKADLKLIAETGAYVYLPIPLAIFLIRILVPINLLREVRDRIL